MESTPIKSSPSHMRDRKAQKELMVCSAWKSLERQGLEVRRIPQINHADAATFVSAVDENTRAIGISWIMFHSGQRNVCLPSVYLLSFHQSGLDILEVAN